MKVKVLSSFGNYKRDAIFDWPKSFAKILLVRGLVEVVEDSEEPEEPVIESADAQEVVAERAVVEHKPQRRRRKK